MQQETQVHLVDGGEQVQSLQGPSRIASVLVAALAAFMGRTSTPATPRKSRKPVPRMVCSPAAEIAAHNASIRDGNTVKRLQADTRRRGRRMDKALADTGQHPKFAKERTHKQAKHALRDEHGAYTLVGRAHPWLDTQVLWNAGRRVWLGGISAQRGY